MNGIDCPGKMPVPQGSTLIIDGQFLIKAVVNPSSTMRTFGDFGEDFLEVTFGYAKDFESRPL